MGYKPQISYEVKNASVPLSSHIDNLVLGADTAETYTIPTEGRYAVVSGTGGFWMKRDTEALASTGVGPGWTVANQPANDGVTVVSTAAGDTTQTVTIIGTTNGTDTVVVEDVALNGVVDADTVKVDWGKILAIKIDAATTGDVELSETSGGAAIVTISAGATSSGVVSYTPTVTQPGGLVQLVADGASTKQIGIKGTNAAGTTIYDSQALTGTTAVLSNSTFATVTEIYTGDLENTVDVTPTVGVASVPAADETDGYGSLYVPSGTSQLVAGGKKLSFCRPAGTATTISVSVYS